MGDPLIHASVVLVAFAMGFTREHPLLPSGAPSPHLCARLAVATFVPCLLWRRTTPVWLLVACLLALQSGGAWALRVRQAGRAHPPTPWSPMEQVSWEGGIVARCVSWPTPLDRDSWQAVFLVLETKARDGQSGPNPGRGRKVLLRGEGPVPVPGEVQTIAVRLRPPGRRSLTGGFSDAVYLWGRGINFRGWILAHPEPFSCAPPSPMIRMAAGVRRAVRERLERQLPHPQAAVAGAVLLGERSPLSRRAAAPFAGLGLSHLFALSGLHVGLLMGMVLLLPTVLHMGAGARFWLSVPLLGLYGLVTGAPASVVRAAGLVVLGFSGPWLGRQAQPVRLVGLLFLLAVFARPAQLLDTGAMLSYLAAGGILLTGSRVQRAAALLPGPLRWATLGAGVSASAQWFTLPVIAGAFGFLNPWSLPANLVTVPVFGLVVGVTVAAVVTAGIPWLGTGVGAWAALGWQVLLSGVDPASRAAEPFAVTFMPPGPVGWLLWAGATVTALGLIGRVERVNPRWLIRSILAGLLLLAVGHHLAGTGRRLEPRDGPVAWQVDVGQGDCALLAFPDRWRCAIDTGGVTGYRTDTRSVWSRTVADYLRRENVGRLDAVLLTHGHLDHTGGARDLASLVEVGEWFSGGHARAPGGAPTRRPRVGEVLHRWGDWRLRVMQAPDPRRDLDENDLSLMVGLEHGNRCVMVWGGDQEVAAERLFLRRNPAFGGAQIWKAGHHGSDTSGSRAFLEALDPRLVVISCGTGNRYHHPSHGPYVVRGDTVPLARTDALGSILLEWSRDGDLRWSTLYGDRGKRRVP